MMENPYEKGSDAWHLAEAGIQIGNEPATTEPQIEATDRIVMAVFQVGAALVARLDAISRKIDEIGPDGTGKNVDGGAF